MHQLTKRTGHCKYILLCLMMLTGMQVLAQLKADFTIDKASGCSPLTVSFFNTSTGTSAGTTYKWDFGNGNTSVLSSAGATYRDEKTYTVTLTVKEGSLSSSKSATITVYKKPEVKFSTSSIKGCLPLPVSFNSSSSAGDGTITNYFWDFGDGNTQQGQSLNQVTHSYTHAQKPAISLTVTNSHGCFNTKEESNILDVLPAIKADFIADKTVLCKETDVVNFTNKSSGPGRLTYTWDFGDSKSSTQDTPSHTFNKKGIYTVKLTARNDDGCSNTAIQTNYLNVANFKTDFSVPQLACKGSVASFTSSSTPVPNYATWTTNDGGYMYAVGNTATYVFHTAGTFKVKLVNNFGGCEESVEKSITVKDAPNLQNFIADMNGVCGAPVTIKFKDTTSSAVKWEWDFNYNYYSFDIDSKEQAPSYTYSSNGYYTAALRAINAEGCTSPVVTRPLNIYKPSAYIYYVSSTSPTGNTGCPGFTMKFAASSSEEITAYKWDFGNGVTSAEKTPEYTFNTEGTFVIKLNYTTKGGCKDIAEYYSVRVYKKPKADFESAATTICGNTPVLFTDKSEGMVTSWIWDFGDADFNSISGLQNPAHQYNKEGTFSIRFIAANGSCYDTTERKNYIKVSPPFPKISSWANTCAGTRGEVTFQQTSKQGTKWIWDFGDSSTTLTLNSDQVEVKHQYTKTGSYKVILTVSNGQCSVKDSVTAYVLLRQNPDISSTLTDVCGSNNLNFKVSGLENNPFPNSSFFNHYYFENLQYGDGSHFNGTNTSPSGYYWTTTYNGTLTGLQNGKKNIRAVLRSYYFGCLDTTNYMPLKIKGPSVGFTVQQNTLCFNSPVTFIDTSKGRNGIAIKKWEWDFGDNTLETATTGGTIKHQYTQPGGYYVNLKVTDNDGCMASTQYYNNYVQASGPKAGISVSASSVMPNTTVYFYNNTNNYNSYNTQYKWLHMDASSTTDYYLSKLYSSVGRDTVKLIATNPDTKCTDTATQVIQIKTVTAAFTFTSSYINNNSCPPLLARFTSQSTNANSISWDFGDGGTGGDQNITSHTYYKPGIYKVILYAYGQNNAMDSSIEYVTVKGPFARLKTDTLYGCDSLHVTLSADVLNASSYTWDLGDGTLRQTQDTFAIHTYVTPGVYTPSLIMKDGSGCSATFELGNKIVIDSLNIGIKGIPDLLCDSAEVFFNSDTRSIAAEQMQQTLIYHWNFGTGDTKDTSNLHTPTFKYRLKGNYEASLKVTSPYGCEEESKNPIMIFETYTGNITGPIDICESGSALFKGAATGNDNINWKWSFGNGSTSVMQDPESQVYKDPGNYTVQLEVDHLGCKHISTVPLIVHAKPTITILPQNPTICLGNSIELVASGGVAYSWAPAAKLNDAAISNPVASPEFTTSFAVKVTSDYGCEHSDSVSVTVARPFKMEVDSTASVCIGNSIQLNASGAASYSWSDVNRELNNTTIANPMATPAGSTRYTVTGYDAYQCFTDKAEVNVTVHAKPTIDAGADIEMLTGDTRRLQPLASNDVREWKWSPADFLSCTNCATPVVLPRKPVTYSVSVKNEYGCESSDTVQLKLLCSDAYIFVPNAFTPNKDSKNEFFYIKGKGISIVRSMRIYNRWGEIVFERKNFYIDDRSAAWDGKFNGKTVPSGSYVYFAELQCDGGSIFTRQGTVTVIY